MISPQCKSYSTKREPSRRRKERRELIVAIFVGLALAASVAYGFYQYSINHAVSH